jgi:methylmalonyl-CoA mutase N-terminal domain/subunit
MESDNGSNPNFKTSESLSQQKYYTASDIKQKHLSNPGEYPFTRGIYPGGYKDKLWTMRMFAGYGLPQETNERFKLLLNNGQTGLSVAFDMPTLYGYDVDHSKAFGEFGRCGVSISSLLDMERLFDQIPIDKITTSMTINSPAPIIWAMFIVTAQKRGIDISRVGGTLQNDILKEFISQNEYIFPPIPSMRLVTDTLEFSNKNMPLWNPISISGYHIREAGATALQELAFTLSNGFTYIDHGLERGLKIDDFAPRLSFFFNVHNDFFEEIAKFRSARKIWAETLKNKYSAQNDRSTWMRFHAQTSGVALTAQQPENNVSRVTIQALAAVLGGCQSLHTNGKDEAWALPSEESAIQALRTQQIIAYETNISSFVDPLGGSYFVESLTEAMEEKAYKYFKEIDSIGGVLNGITSGYFEREITESAYQTQLNIDNGSEVIVGVNEFKTKDSSEIPLLKVDAKGFEQQVQTLEEVRRTRDNTAVRRKLRDLKIAAKSEQNLMPLIIECVSEYSTLGEIMEVFREVFGEHSPNNMF